MYYEPRDAQRIVVFTSNLHLKMLYRAKFWVMDGTFKSAPSLFCQIYAIHGCVNGVKWVPLVIALLENKSQATYEHLLEILKEEVQTRVRKRLAPRIVSTDYEKAAIQAVLAAFPGT